MSGVSGSAPSPRALPQGPAIAYETFDHAAGITRALFNVHPADECAMAEILVMEIRARRLSAAGVLFAEASGSDGASSRRPTGREHSTGCPTIPIALRIVFHCFFHCFSLFLRRRIFRSLRKGLHCNWRAFSIVNPLYFSKKIFRRRATRDRDLKGQSDTGLPFFAARKRGGRSR